MKDILTTNGQNANFVSHLIKNEVEFIVVGGIAVVYHGCRNPMEVDDLDILINPTLDNAERFIESLPELNLKPPFKATDIAKPKVQIPIKKIYYLDVLTPPEGIEFVELMDRSLPAILNSLAVKVVSRPDLIALKKIAVQEEGSTEKHEKDLACLETANTSSSSAP
jgi:hypothetical protein